MTERRLYLKASFGRNGHLQSMWNIFELAWQTKTPSETMPVSTNYGHTMAKSPILCGPNSNHNPNNLDLKVFCRNSGWLMENMDKRLKVPKWVLLNQLKIPQMPQNLSAQIVCPSPKVWDFDVKRLHLVSVVRVR